MRGLLTVIVCMMATPAFAAKIVLVAGGGETRDAAKGVPVKEAKLIAPFGIAFSLEGRLYFVEMEKGERFCTILEDGRVHVIAGSGKKGPPIDNVKLPEMTFNGMHGLACLNKSVLIADTWNNCVRVYFEDRHGQLLFRLIGSGRKGFSGDGGGIKDAELGGVYSLCVNLEANEIYIADLDNHRIRKVKEGIITTCAGNGKVGHPKDGKKATEEPLFDPRAVAMDKDANLYILERGAHCLRVVNKDGIIKTVMGTGKAGTAVGKALESQMNGPKHLCIDKDGSVIIADAENHRILRYIPKDEKVVVIAGTGKKGSAGLDGDPLKCELNRPHGVCVHPKTGELYICDSYNDRILKIVP